MQDSPELLKLYKNFRKFADEAGSYFRHKEEYSSQEKIDFILAFYLSCGSLLTFFESDEELRNGKSITITGGSDIGRVTLTMKHIQDEFDTAVSIIYFNLSTDDFDKMFLFCKDHSMLRELAVLKKLFGKFLQS